MVNSNQIIVIWFKKQELTSKAPHILVCPLDWGIGHATRCIPLIRQLTDRKVNVIMAADNRPLMLLRQEFPELPYIRFPGYRFTYPESSQMAFKMAIQAPRIMNGIRQENHKLDQIIRQYAIDAVISDNRFGLYSKRIPAIFMTHQLFIQTPNGLRFLKPLLNRQNRHYISKFTECWIPDFEDEPNLSGVLSHNNTISKNYFYIGPQTRFQFRSETAPSTVEFEILAILSGPEPQRSILEEKLLNALTMSEKKVAMVLGKPELPAEKVQKENLTIYNHLDGPSLHSLILSSAIIISRPGYSTLMDLAALGKKAIFIPTPGQTEQEYLARHCLEQKLCFYMPQDQFNLAYALNQSTDFKGLRLMPRSQLLEHRLDALMERIA
ncbi:MAG: glycosyltransferase [Bacteroidetes bacterium]|nr:glycosyltransferase [Bacteroidota bacterium]